MIRRRQKPEEATGKPPSVTAPCYLSQPPTDIMAPPQLPRIPRPPMNSSRLTFPHGSQYRVGTPTPTSIRLVHWALGTHTRRAVRRQLATAHIRAERCAGNWPRNHTPGWQRGEAPGHGGRDSGRGTECSGAHWALGYMGEHARIVL